MAKPKRPWYERFPVYALDAEHGEMCSVERDETNNGWVPVEFVERMADALARYENKP